MWQLSDVTIRRKLTLTTMTTTLLALLLACAAFVSHDLIHFRQTMASELLRTASLLGDSSSAALSFNDPAAAEQTLRSLRSAPGVVGGAIFDSSGRVFATYQRAGTRVPFKPPAVESDGYRFERDALRLFHPIDLAGTRAGTIYLQSDLTELRDRLWRYGLIVVIVLVAAASVALPLSTRLQASISQPISHLAGVVGAVAANKDYSVRAAQHGKDELGRLIDGFNDMLGQIQTRDAELERARGELERRVAERTQELRLEVVERQGSEAALRESNLRYEMVTQATTNVIWDWDLGSGSVGWNENFQGVFGYPSDEIGSTLESWTGRVHPDDAPAVVSSIHTVIDGGGDLWSHEYRFRRYDGSYAFVFDRGYVVRDDQGEPVRMIGAMQDFTDRKRTEMELEETHRQLLEASRRSGMAEIATNVLHNVGNVLNSVNVSASLITETVKRSKVASLNRAAALLREHQGELAAFLSSDERGRHLPDFLAQLSEHLAADREETLRELDGLRSNIEHIKEIVAMQQSYAKISGVLEEVSVNDLVEDSLRMNFGALKRHGIEVRREFHPVPRVLLDKHKVLQILVNLIRNAKDACDESRSASRLLTLGVAVHHDKVRISVADNGIGIPPENLTRIFSHGFTTRESGHGFGLHSGALAATEMGGSLTAHSEGSGHGATFVLELPAEPAIARR